MRILVTGSTGFLGSHVVRIAAERGHDVRALVRPAGDASRLGLDETQIVRGDMTDAASLTRAAKGIEAVVHCAAATSSAATDLAAARRVNVQGTRDLVRAVLASARAEGREAPRWIQISTMSAHAENPSVYGRTKLEADDVVKGSGIPGAEIPTKSGPTESGLAKSGLALRWTILRPSIIYGTGGGGIAAKTLELMKKLPILPVVGSGRELLRPVLVEDIAAAALDCLAWDEEPDGARTGDQGDDRAGSPVGKTYMIGGPDEVTFNEFLERLGAQAGVRRPTLHLPLWACMAIARVLGAVMANPPLTTDNVLGVRHARRVEIEDAIRDFGFAPTGFEEGLRRTYGE